MNEAERTAWAAGLFEGEGSIAKQHPGHGNRNKKTRWQLALSTTDEDVARLFAEIVQVGKLYGPYKQTHRKVNGESCKLYWKWMCSDKTGVTIFAKRFSRFLGKRRAEMLTQAMKDFESVVGRTTFTMSERIT